MPVTSPRIRWLLLLIGVATGATFLARLIALSTIFPYDFAINWTAALAMRQGIPIYDQAKLRELSVQNVAPIMATMYDQTFENYIGPPTTAALHIPFTFLPFEVAIGLYRALILGTAALAVWIAAQALPQTERRLGVGVGLFSLCLLQSFAVSIMLGQVDHWIMLGLGLSLWAARKDRWLWVGVGSGMAGLLKVSPFILLVYGLLRRRPRVLVGASGAIGLAIAVTLPYGWQLWSQFAQQVAPSLSASTLSIENQSWPGYLARMTSAETDLYQTSVPLGALARFAPVMGVVLIAIVYFAARNNHTNDGALRLSLLSLAALMTGPITWDSYFSWAAVALTQFAELWRWQGLPRSTQWLALVLMIIGLLLANVPLNYLFFKAEVFAGAGWLRMITGPRTIAVTLWFIVGLMLLRSKPCLISENPVSQAI